jgi:hypothetical protein
LFKHRFGFAFELNRHATGRARLHISCLVHIARLRTRLCGRKGMLPRGSTTTIKSFAEVHPIGPMVLAVSTTKVCRGASNRSDGVGGSDRTSQKDNRFAGISSCGSLLMKGPQKLDMVLTIIQPKTSLALIWTGTIRSFRTPSPQRSLSSWSQASVVV